jgi:hypothetical protein
MKRHAATSVFEPMRKRGTQGLQRPVRPEEEDDKDSEADESHEDEGKFRVKKAHDDKQKLKPNPGADFVGKHPFRGLIVGESGSGKTTLLVFLLNTFYRVYFDKIYIWSPNYHIDGTWKNLRFEPDKVFTEFLEDDVNALRDEQLHAITRFGVLHAPKVLCIIDDFANDWEVMHSRGLERFYTIARHWNVSTLVLVQKYNKVSLTIRTNASILCCFHASNTTEFEQIRDEQTSQLITKREFTRLFNEATTREKHGFLTINHQADSKDIYRYNLKLVQPITKSREQLEDEERRQRQQRRKEGFEANQKHVQVEGIGKMGE